MNRAILAALAAALVLSSCKKTCGGGDADTCRTDCEERGVPEACFKAGAMYEHGDSGAPKNGEFAERLYTKGCDAKNGPSCNALGLLSATNNGWFFEKACRAKFPEGCFNQGVYLRRTRNAPPFVARVTFETGCELGNKPSCDAAREIKTFATQDEWPTNYRPPGTKPCSCAPNDPLCSCL